ncbi:MAG: SpoIVB peptidase [Oscillospiraceae bacterium]|nr:SpoIVB peptidase [Oscillospiraceae bacterium]
MKKSMKKWLSLLLALLFSLLLGAVIVVRILAGQLPDTFTVAPGESLDLSSRGLCVSHFSASDTTRANSNPTKTSYEAQVSFLGLPVKTVTVTEADRPTVIPGGTPFGIKLFTNGVVVVGVSSISTASGDRNPAEEAGIQLGDIITKVNGKAVTETEMISTAMTDSNGAPVTMTLRRGTTEQMVTVHPARSDFDGTYKGGIWVRDSTAGIGIVTFYQPETNVFGGLGHGICDVDTNDLMPLRIGEIVPVCISGVVPGRQGQAGELQGYFTSNNAMGRLLQNGDTGVYGTLDGAPSDRSPVQIALKQEVHKGSAQILTTIDGESPQWYAAEIESIDLREDSSTKNLVIHITDETLLQKTGGIVQGMSGSPILQDGRLVGAVTHVFVHDPTRGYGIFAETMVDVSEEIGNNLSQ